MFSCDKSFIMFNLSTNFEGTPGGKQKEEKWRLFHAKDFQSFMYPCFTFCHIFGIFPYKINATTFEVSKPHFILSIVVTSITGIYALMMLFGSPILGKLDMLNLPGNLADGCNFVFGGFIMIITFILTGQRIRLLQNILKISSRLPSESYEKLSRLIHTKDIIGPLLVAIVMITSSACRGHFEINFLIQIYINVMVFEMDMLYMNCVCVLKMCFKRINDDLANIRRIIVNDESHIFKLNYQRNHFLIMELKTLKKQHLVITDTVRMLNSIFGLQLVATIIMMFCDITFTLYYYILFCLYLFLSNTSENMLFHVCYLSYLAHSFIKIALIVWACETGKNQALQISVSIHDVFNVTTDEPIKDEVL